MYFCLKFNQKTSETSVSFIKGSSFSLVLLLFPVGQCGILTKNQRTSILDSLFFGEVYFFLKQANAKIGGNIFFAKCSFNYGSIDF